MKSKFAGMKNGVAEFCVATFGGLRLSTAKEVRVYILLIGLALFSVGTGEVFAQGLGSGTGPDFNPTRIECAVGLLFKLIEGAFGALIMVVAGLAAIMAAAMGAYRAAVGMLVVAVGAFILRSLVSLFFSGNFVDCSISGGIN